MKTLLYRIDALPDPADPAHRKMAGGDLHKAINKGVEHYLRVVAEMPVPSVTTAIRFDYTPSPKDGHPQSRLSVSMGVQTASAPVARIMETFIEAGPLSQSFTFAPERNRSLNPRTFGAACRIYRKDACVRPFTDRNPDAMSSYYACNQFVPEDTNDYMPLDRVLSDINERVVISLAIRPTDAGAELTAHTQYLERLNAINQKRRGSAEDQAIDLLRSADARWRDPSVVEPIREEDPIAEDVCREQKDIQKTLRVPHLAFAFTVLAESEEVARLIGSVVAAGGCKNGSYQLNVTTDRRKVARYCDEVACMVVADAAKDPDLTRNAREAGLPGLQRLAHIATVDELGGIWRLPVPGPGSPLCIRKDTDPVEATSTDYHEVGYDSDGPAQQHASVSRRSGRRLWNITRGVPLGVLAKHMFVSGMPGKGKTTFNLRLLLRLHKAGIPFIVIETAKREYRTLCMLKNHPDPAVRDLAKRIELYNIDDQTLSPLRVNPLQKQSGVSRNRQVATLLDCVQASVPLEPPLPALIREGIEMTLDQADAGAPPPTMDRLLSAVVSCLRRKKYSPENESNARAAIDVRLGMLTSLAMAPILQCPISVPDVQHMLTTPTIIELDDLSQGQKCMTTLMLLTAIREAVRTSQSQKKGLRLVVLIEEAHNVVGARTDARPSESAPDSLAFVAEYMSRMLAECRALGIGIVISDQFASAVAPQVTKSTATKIAFGQGDSEERDKIGSSMLFRGIEDEDIARLSSGEAYFFTEGYFGPRKTRTINLHSTVDLTPPNDDDLRKAIRETEWWRDATRARVSGELSRFGPDLDAFATSCKTHGETAKAALVSCSAAIKEPRDPNRESAITKDLRNIRARLQDTVRAFERGPLAHYMPQEDILRALGTDMVQRVGELKSRFKTIRGEVESITDKIDQLMGVIEAKRKEEVTS